MDTREELSKLGEPDLAAVDRIGRRFRRTRAGMGRDTRRRRALGAALLALAAALVVAVLAWPESEREVTLASVVTPVPHTWSDTVQVEALGRGAIRGTGRDARVDWQAGTVRVHVTPDSGTALSVRTPEALVEVVGTVFAVKRDALGSSVSVERGRVRVTCEVGGVAEIGPGDTHACLPATAAGLLGRAEALSDAHEPAEAVREALDRGVALAGPGPVRGELLFRRMHLHAAAGRVDDALSDASAYLDSPSGRSDGVRRFAAWTALSARGCEAAMPWLLDLHERDSAEESVLLAECVASTDPARARDLALHALPSLDDAWSDRAVDLLAGLEVP